MLGIAVVVAASMLGEPDVAWLGLLMAGLPIVAVLVVLLMRPRLAVERTVEPPQVSLGSRPEVVLNVRNSRAASLSGLEFHDKAPARFGANAQFAFVRGLGRWSQRVGYDVQADQRGNFLLGPLRATAHDALGLARRTWTVPGDDATLRVTPKVWQLRGLSNSLGLGSAGDSTPQRIGMAGQDDVLVREHRYGDDLRRVHWRLSAKQDELMVRLEEHPWDPAVTVLLDNRRSAHFGEGPGSTLEWAISLAASVSAEMLASRYRVTLLSADSELLSPSHLDALSSHDRMLQQLTDVEASGRETLREGLSETTAVSNSQSIIAVLGMVTATDAAALVAVGTRMLQTTALVPDGAAFGAAPEAVATHGDACRLLESSGWTLHRFIPGESVPDAWSRLLQRREAR